MGGMRTSLIIISALALLACLVVIDLRDLPKPVVRGRVAKPLLARSLFVLPYLFGLLPVGDLGLDHVSQPQRSPSTARALSR